MPGNKEKALPMVRASSKAWDLTEAFASQCKSIPSGVYHGECDSVNEKVIR